jgi:dynactin 4
MPSVSVSLPPLNAAVPLPAKRLAKTSGILDEEKSPSISGGMLAGKTYPFHLSFTNPMYDPIQVRLAVQRASVSPAATTSSEASTATAEKRRPPFAVSLPTSSFSVAAFAEAWEYDEEDDDNMFDDEYAEVDERIRKTTGRISGKSRTVGVLEKKTNMTLIGGEVVIGKEARGDVKVLYFLAISLSSVHSLSGQFNIMVTFTYRSDDPSIDDQEMADPPSSRTPSGAGVATSSKLGTKTFSFYAVVDLGPIVPREDAKTSLDDS